MSSHRKPHDPEVHPLRIFIRSTRGEKQFSFSERTTIAAVIDKAVNVFEFREGDRFELALATNLGKPLQPRRTLASYRIKDRSVLVLTSVGGGV